MRPQNVHLVKGANKQGRKKGVPNKVTGQLKEMILKALDKSGGVNYLTKQAKDEPRAFLALLGRVLPLQLQGDSDQPLVVQIVKYGDDKPSE